MSNPLSNDGAERAVLGAMLLDEDAVEYVLGRVEDPAAFTTGARREIFAAVRDLHDAGEKIDTVTLQGALKRRGTIESAGGATALVELMVEVHSTANVDHYVSEVLDRWRARRVIAAGEKIARLDASQSGVDLLGQAAAVLSDLEADAADEVQFVQVRAEDFERDIEAPDQEVCAPIHWAPMRKALGGFSLEGELIVLGARTSIGKTALMLSWALEELRAGTPVGILSLEKSWRSLRHRIMARAARVELQKIGYRGGKAGGVGLTGAEKTAIARSVLEVVRAPLLVVTRDEMFSGAARGRAPSVARVCAIASRMAKRGCRLIFVDQLRRIEIGRPVRGERMDQVVGSGVRAIQAQVAWRHRVPVVLLHQLNREAEGSKDRPKISELRDSGMIEEDAERVILIHRHRSVDTNVEANTDIIVAKSSDGWTGDFDMYFAPQCAAYFGSKFDEGETFYSQRNGAPEPTGADRAAGDVSW